MLVYRTFKELREFLDLQDENGRTIGFVPTMGALHEGHLSLLDESKKQCDITVCSIFVNPTQFNNPEDLKKYPRSNKDDLKKLKSIQCDIAFLPTVDEVYPENIVSSPIDLIGLDTVMEGAHRPGHFDGVVQVVWRFFKQIKPTKAFFGEKDFQQLAIIKRLVLVKESSIEIVPCPILREDSGLAMSSRNVRLSDKGRQQAIFISEQLNLVKSLFVSESISGIKEIVEKNFENKPEFNLEYFEIAELDTLKSVIAKEQKTRAFVAVQIEDIRLIDNIALNY